MLLDIYNQLRLIPPLVIHYFRLIRNFHSDILPVLAPASLIRHMD